MKKFILTMCLALTGCGSSDAELSGLIPGAGSGSSSDVRALVSQGENLSFNNRTAGANDMALNPVTKLPAVAYHDRDHNGGGTGATPALGALKFAYMDAYGTWNVEVIDVSYGSVACGLAGSFCIGAPNNALGTSPLNGIIKLAFKSDGTPAIAYVYGASLTGPGNKEIRYAERSSAGVWTVQRAHFSTIGATASDVNVTAAVNPFSGVTLLFDASDRPHITAAQYASTISNSMVKYIFRNSAGTWSVSNITPAVTVSGTITGATQGAMQAGSAWCSAGSVATGSPQAPIYAYPKVTGTGGWGHPTYIYCTAMSTAGECTSWTAIDMISGCGGVSACSSSLTYGADNQQATGTNAGARIDITIEPTNNKPVMALFSATAVAGGAITSLYSTTAPNACSAAQPATANSWNTFTQVDATANAGLNGFRINAKSSTTYYISYLLAAATVRQTRSVNSGAAWFGAGHIVETPTAVGAEGMGAAYDLTNDVLYASYGSGGTAAVNVYGNDIRVAYADPDNLSSGGLQGASHFYETIDNTGNSFPAPLGGAVPLMSAARAANGTVGFAYFFHDNSGAAFPDSKLYYGIRAGSATSPVFSNRWVTNHLEGSSALLAAGLSPSLVYDANSNPIIAYQNATTANTSNDTNLVVARSGNGGISFSQTTVDDTPAAVVGLYPSAAVYGTAIGVAYQDFTNTGLKFARWTPSGQWKTYFVDGLGGAGGTGCAVGTSEGAYAKLAFTSTGRPVIVYQEAAATSQLRIAVAAEAVNNSSGTFTWTCLTLDSTGAPVSATGNGTGIDIALDSSDRPHIIHFSLANGDYRYITSSSAVLTAVATGSNSFTNTSLATVTAPSPAGANTVPQIKVNSSGTIYVSYHDVQNRALVLGTKASGAASFTNENIEQGPSYTGITTPFAGQFPSMLLNASGKPLLFYRSWENWIRYFSRE